VLVLLLLSPCARADGHPASAPVPAASVSHFHSDPTAEKLNQAIESTLRKDEFSWRLPRPETNTEHDGIILRTFRSFLHFLKDSTAGIFKVIGKFFKWLLEREKKDSSTSDHSFGFGNIPWRALAWVFIITILLGLLYLLIQFFRNSPATSDLQSVDATPVRTVDLEAEDVRADDLPEDSWLKLAQELATVENFAWPCAPSTSRLFPSLPKMNSSGSLRQVQSRLSPGNDRRLRGDTAAIGFFRQNINLFEASWYGTHDVTSAILDNMRINHQQVRSHATA